MLNEEKIIAQTREWVDKIVVGHNFCPFAHKPSHNNTIRYSVCMTDQADEVAERLMSELLLLKSSDHSEVETTVLVTPQCFQCFDDYNQFLDVVDMLIEKLHLEGEIQVASFHPDYQFADLDKEDVRNYTNRSLYPMFHLILESSIEHARASYPDVDAIPENNMVLLENMGLDEAKRQLKACENVEP